MSPFREIIRSWIRSHKRSRVSFAVCEVASSCWNHIEHLYHPFRPIKSFHSSICTNYPLELLHFWLHYRKEYEPVTPLTQKLHWGYSGFSSITSGFPSFHILQFCLLSYSPGENGFHHWRGRSWKNLHFPLLFARLSWQIYATGDDQLVLSLASLIKMLCRVVFLMYLMRNWCFRILRHTTTAAMFSGERSPRWQTRCVASCTVPVSSTFFSNFEVLVVDGGLLLPNCLSSLCFCNTFLNLNRIAFHN